MLLFVHLSFVHLSDGRGTGYILRIVINHDMTRYHFTKDSRDLQGVDSRVDDIVMLMQ